MSNTRHPPKVIDLDTPNPPGTRRDVFGPRLVVDNDPKVWRRVETPAGASRITSDGLGWPDVTRLAPLPPLQASTLIWRAFEDERGKIRWRRLLWFGLGPALAIVVAAIGGAFLFCG